MNIEILWSMFHDPLKGYIMKRVHDHSIVDDIVQNVFLKIYTNINSLREEQKIQSWVYQITRNAIIDYYRKEKPIVVLSSTIEMTEDTLDAKLLSELASCLKPMIEQLPHKYREALELTELQGLSQKQLGERLGLSFSGAKSRVQRGRAKLKDIILACCHVESDRYGNILDYYPVSSHQSDCTSANSCQS